MDPRIETSLSRALETGDFRDLLERAAPAMGLPGHKPKLELSRALGQAIAADRERGLKRTRALVALDREDAKLIAAAAFGAIAAGGGNRKEPLLALQELAGEAHISVRIGVIDALRTMLAADLPTTLADLVAWTDGFLQAHVALEALTERQVLASIPRVDALLAILEPAFRLADDSPRAADRWQGVRALRQGLPVQIATFVGRFSELYAWVIEHAAATRPETRVVIEETADALHRAAFRRADVDAVRAALAKSAKVPRDAARIVHGTRKRGRR